MKSCWKSDLVIIPRILIVIRIPDSLDESLLQADDKLVLKHCGHWISLKGRPPLSGKGEYEMVKIPLKNKFDVNALQNMMRSVAENGKLIC